MKVTKANINSLAPVKIQTQFVAEVEFGMPSRKCRNFGICRIHPLTDNFQETFCGCKADANRSSAVITVYNPNYIEFDFLKNSISAKDYDKFFSDGKFKIREQYSFSYFDDQKTNFTITIGEYYVIENNSMLKVVFQQ